MKRILAIAICLLGTTTDSISAKPPVFEDALKKKIEAVVEPAEAKPGQTVTLKIKVELNPGWSTYPTVQEDKGAQAQVNRIIFPEVGSMIFVGKVIDPANPKSKREPDAFIEKLLYYPENAVYTQKAVISPLAKAGESVVPVQLRIVVCDKDNCIPKTVNLQATVRIAGVPVPVEAKYKEQVEKAIKK